MKRVEFPYGALLALVSLICVIASCTVEEQGTATGPDESQSATPFVSSAESGLLPHQQMAKEFLRELIEINTTQSTGNTTVAADAMAAHLIAAGFPREDVQVLGPVDNKGNLVVRYRGRDVGRKPLLLLAHIDVVEADPADWTLDPFRFTE